MGFPGQFSGEDLPLETREVTDFIGGGWPAPSDPPTPRLEFTLTLGALKAA